MPNFRSRSPYSQIPPMPLPPIVPAELGVEFEDPYASPLAPVDDFSDPAYGQPHGFEELRDGLTGDTFFRRLQQYAPPSAYVGTFRGRG